MKRRVEILGYVRDENGKKSVNKIATSVGTFHGFSAECEEVVAIVELADGSIELPLASFIRFCEPEEEYPVLSCPGCGREL